MTFWTASIALRGSGQINAWMFLWDGTRLPLFFDRDRLRRPMKPGVALAVTMSFLRGELSMVREDATMDVVDRMGSPTGVPL
jgi:hypothetical protein